eukprot:UN16802
MICNFCSNMLYCQESKKFRR